MSDRNPRWIDPHSLVEITCRTTMGQYLLVPPLHRQIVWRLHGGGAFMAAPGAMAPAPSWRRLVPAALHRQIVWRLHGGAFMAAPRLHGGAWCRWAGMRLNEFRGWRDDRGARLRLLPNETLEVPPQDAGRSVIRRPCRRSPRPRGETS